ncbi:Per1-like protein [Fistulina hepatica ATCC 64428]|uniref:Post-GPI attachment to proteins factor 3 n=1 Tax=Fistulina hepatica ATCC 64428 TaxID=1128425 RepID=A0A0D7AB52_9AGAR|nr:Per1-like protein [Fistulina hepatica ATCC 64428]
MRGLISCLILCVGLALASSGDRAVEFRNCVDKCTVDACPRVLPLFLRLTMWTCPDDCKYTCMHAITDVAITSGFRVQQYYGKWPFWRLAGMQEPASVAFSLLNLWAHAYGGARIRKSIPDSHPMKVYYVMWSYVSINTWLWSAVFHTRDLPSTEKLDYFSAALTILCAFHYTVIRLFRLYPAYDAFSTSVSGKSRTTVRRLWNAVCMTAFIVHVTYLTLLPRFDYTYNMAFSLVIGMLHNALWLVYASPIRFQRFPLASTVYRPSFVNKAGVFVILTMASTLLELFDFPPFARVLDAHALWHLTTAPIAVYWYRFLLEDCRDEGWRHNKM